MTYPSAACVALLIAGVAGAQPRGFEQSTPSSVRDSDRQFAMQVIRSECIAFADMKRGLGPLDFQQCRVSEFGDETEEWHRELSTRIPDGLQVLKRVWPNLQTMEAEAGLYRPGDANCCPTGGVARIRLAIRARRMVIDSVVVGKNQ